LNYYNLKFNQLYNTCPFDIPLERERQIWLDGLVCGTHISTAVFEKNGLKGICSLKAIFTKNSLKLLNNCIFYNGDNEFCKYSWFEYSE
jgi:hypothetical protein